ncbi:MAG: hypothetical protein RQ833_07200 [Sphingomonadaceae bacterium]|nr:hypothetical protein [Sphingomonadaceae bacterium]
MRNLPPIIGLLLGLALLAAALLVPQQTLEELLSRTGIAGAVQLFQPPVGMAGRAALGGGGFVLSALLGWALRGRRSPETDADDDDRTAARTSRYGEARRFASTGPVGRVRASAEPTVPPSAGRTFSAPARPVVETGAAAAEPHADGPKVEHRPALPPKLDAPDLSARANELPTIDAVQLSPQTDGAGATHAPVPDPAQPPHAAPQRVASIPAEIASHAPDHAVAQRLTDRIDRLEEQVGAQLRQIAQQVAEIAATTRQMARTPAPAAPQQAARRLAPQALAGVDRQRIAAAARALRDSLPPVG